MKLVGYSDRWSLQPGETIRFFVSSDETEYRAHLVRMRHGDQSPKGPGPRSTGVDAELNRTYVGRRQEIRTGSYIRIDAFDVAAKSFTLTTWVAPTAPTLGAQTLMAKWDPIRTAGFGLGIDAGGSFSGWVGLPSGRVTISSRRSIRGACWYFLALTYDAISGALTLRTDLLRPSPVETEREVVAAHVQGAANTSCAAPLLLGAEALRRDSDFATCCFNGKMSAPRAFARAASADEFEQLSVNDLMSVLAPASVGEWDLSHSPAGREIPDRSSSRHHGVAVNRPTRAVTGHNWKARTDSFVETPSEFNAVHFHDDDLEDARWQEDFRWRVPEAFPSGIYAVVFEAKDASDILPFFIRPPTGHPTAAVAVLLPTLSYLAYSNSGLNIEAMDPVFAASAPLRNANLQPTEYAYLASTGMNSTYDSHRDGSGVCHATMLRPSLTSMRPYHRTRTIDAPHQLSADLHLIDWLEAKAIPYDILTDHDLHREGAELLRSYKTVLTGTHAEYWSREMLDGLEVYQAGGGRVVYLSGNGLYWVTALDPEHQTVCEVRRANGTRTWTSAPGEGRLAFTGEPGGLWALRGLPPQRYVGVGMAAQGFDRGTSYRRTQESRDPRVAFIFKGIEGDLIGDIPALVLTYGAAGFEVDRADRSLGTPAHALVLASSLPFSDSYQAVIEESTGTAPYQGGLTKRSVRGDMVFFETLNGGAVFSVGSISFCSTLSYNHYDNTTSRLLENVVRTFSCGEPLPGCAPQSGPPAIGI